MCYRIDSVSRFALVGFSMGGNLVLKLAGEWGSEGPPQFRAVAAVCPAIDLAASADALHEPANRIYEYYFLMQLFQRLRRKARFFPDKFDLSRLRGISTLRQFDDRITAHYCGFTGADDYYARAAASNVVDRIAVPTLIIHAKNDPFIRMQPETLRRIATNPNITYIETHDGGHCAFRRRTQRKTQQQTQQRSRRRWTLGRARSRGLRGCALVRLNCSVLTQELDENLRPIDGLSPRSNRRRL